jgi:DNA-binding MarR family transcriptional regulator
LSTRKNREDLLAEVAEEAPRQAAAGVRLSIAIAHQLGLSLADVQCMGLLVDGPSAPSHLAERLGLTTGAMTKVLDRLERVGYISRAADPSDRRRVVIAAEPAGLAELGRYYGPMGERMAEYVSGRTATELETILAFMRAGREAAEQEIARVRGQGVRHATRRARDAVDGAAS